MAAQYIPTVVIDLPPPAQPPADDDLPSYLPPRVSSFSKPPPLSHETPESTDSNANPNASASAVTGADEEPIARSAVVAQTAIRGYLARKDYHGLHEQNRWRLEAPAATGPRLISPAKDKAHRKSRPPSRGFRVESLHQHSEDPEPSGTPDELHEEEDEEDDKPRAVRKSYAPGMLAPGMGIGDFNPTLVRLKSAPRPVSMDLKIAAQSPPLQHHMLKPTPALVPPASLSSNTAATKSMPDMPQMPKLKSVPKSGNVSILEETNGEQGEKREMQGKRQRGGERDWDREKGEQIIFDD